MCNLELRSHLRLCQASPPDLPCIQIACGTATDPLHAAMGDEQPEIVDATCDAQAYHAFLLSFDVDGLKAYLETITLCRLRDAAAAMGVLSRIPCAPGTPRLSRARGVIVEEIINKVVAAKDIVPGTALHADEERRQSRAVDLQSRAAVLAACTRIPLLAANRRGEHHQDKEDILLYECPEELRLAVVSEFFAASNRKPNDAATEFAEVRAAAYLNSALSRRWVRTSSGEQLTTGQIAQWEAIWAMLPEAERPTWWPEPLLNRQKELLSISASGASVGPTENSAAELDGVCDDVSTILEFPDAYTPEADARSEHEELAQTAIPAVTAELAPQIDKPVCTITHPPLTRLCPIADNEFQQGVASWVPTKKKTESCDAIASLSAGSCLEEPCTPRRYCAKVWGMMGSARGGRGLRQPGLTSGADYVWDLAACRKCLLQLDLQDLRGRLNRSPWQQGKAPNSINWLKEAAISFSVSLRKSQANGAPGAYRSKPEIIEDVLEHVKDLQTAGAGTAGWRDGSRRLQRMSELNSRGKVLRAVKNYPLLAAKKDQEYHALREGVLLYECPEELRLDVVEEFLSNEKRLPCADAQCLREQRAALYFDSALARKHQGTPTGPILAPAARKAWERLVQEFLANELPIGSKLRLPSTLGTLCNGITDMRALGNLVATERARMSSVPKVPALHKITLTPQQTPGRKRDRIQPVTVCMYKWTSSAPEAWAFVPENVGVDEPLWQVQLEQQGKLSITTYIEEDFGEFLKVSGRCKQSRLGPLGELEETAGIRLVVTDTRDPDGVGFRPRRAAFYVAGNLQEFMLLFDSYVCHKAQQMLGEHAFAVHIHQHIGMDVSKFLQNLKYERYTVEDCCKHLPFGPFEAQPVCGVSIIALNLQVQTDHIMDVLISGPTFPYRSELQDFGLQSATYSGPNGEKKVCRIMQHLDVGQVTERARFKRMLGKDVFNDLILYVKVDAHIPAGSAVESFVAELQAEPSLYFEVANGHAPCLYGVRN